MFVDVALLKGGMKTGKWIPAKVLLMLALEKYAVEVQDSPYAREKKWIGKEFQISKDNLRFQQVQLNPPMPDPKPDKSSMTASPTKGGSGIDGPISIQSIAKYRRPGDDGIVRDNVIRERYKCRQCARTLPQFMYSKPQQKMAQRIINHLPICLECAVTSPEECSSSRTNLRESWEKTKSQYYRCSVTGYTVLLMDMDDYLKSKKYEEAYNEAMPQVATIEKFSKEMRNNPKYYGEQFRIFPFCKFPPRSKSDIIKPLPHYMCHTYRSTVT